MSEIYGPTPATERDVTLAWRDTERAAEDLAADPDDAEAWASAKSAFGTFVAASRSAERADESREAGQ